MSFLGIELDTISMEKRKPVTDAAASLGFGGVCHMHSSLPYRQLPYLQHLPCRLQTYCQPGDHDERCTLQSCILLDEWEQPLHSAADYQRAILHVLELYPPLKQYIQQYTLLFAAD
ncbi:hypothetical protein Bbelb_048540 [Branchiostoma belcheri]|nr:hypothetical protein Bbelb_048540 [Branchiostoma belcheri]